MKFINLASEIVRELAYPFPSVIHVLVVDDSEVEFGLAKRALESQERTPVFVEYCPPEKALETIALKAHDVYVVDILLGGGQPSGLEIIAKAKKQGLPGPFVVLTGSRVANADEEAMKVGAMDYVDKDELLSKGVLIRSLRYAIKNHRVLVKAKSVLESTSTEPEQKMFFQKFWK